MPQVVCARCGREFLENYPSCPWCGTPREKANATTGSLHAAAPAPASSAAPIPKAAYAVIAVCVPKMPVWQLSWHGIKLPFAKVPRFFGMAIVPMGIVAACQLVTEGLASITGVPSLYYLWLIALVADVPFHVGWFRLLILGPEAVKGRGYFPFEEREKRYLGYYLIVGLIAFLPWVVAHLWEVSLPEHSAARVGVTFLALAAAVFGSIASVRFYFVFPAIATDRFSGLAASWEQTSGIALRLYGITLLTPIPFAIALLIANLIELTSSGIPTRIMATAVGVLILHLAVAAGFGVIGIAYRDWGIRIPGQSGQPLATST